MVAHDIAPTTLRLLDPWSPMGHAVIADPDITDAEFRLIAAIKRHDWRDGICRASQAELGRHCAKDERTVRRLVCELKKKGLLEEINDPSRPGRARVYRLLGIAATTPQTGQCWPVEGRGLTPQSGQDRTDKLAEVGRINRPHPAGLKKTPENPEKTPELTAATQPAPPAPTKPLNLDGPPRPAPKPTPPPPVDDLPVPPGMRRMRLRSTDGVTIREILVPISKPAPSSPPPPTPSPKPLGQQRYGQVIALLREAGVEYRRSDVDAAAVKASDGTPEEIVACLLAMLRGEWGSNFQRERASVRTVCREYLTPWLNRERTARPQEKDYRETRYGRRIFTGQPGAPVSSDAYAKADRWRETEL